MIESSSNNYSNSSVIVGFVQWFDPKRSRLSEISSTLGIVKIKHIYSIINAALVEVRPNSIDIFISEVSKLDYVEYCHKNYLITSSVYEGNIHESYRDNQHISCDFIRKIHGLSIKADAGCGVKIATIDSGLSPHPYLPATSFLEASFYKDTWPTFIRKSGLTSFTSEIIEGEKQSLFSSSSSLVQQDFITFSKSKLNEFLDKLSEEWLYDTAYAWSYKGRMREDDIPALPIYPHILGLMRRISLESYNFVDDNLNVTDKYGHGTKMAGILVGRMPTSYCMRIFGNPSFSQYLSQYEVDVVGIVPMAELLVLKCYDSQNLENSNVGNLIRAIEYARINDSDIIYTGVSLNNKVDPKLSYSLGRAIDNVGIPVVCPAGNSKKEELALPAAYPEAIAVTCLSVDKSSKKILFSEDSNWAKHGDGEKVTFSALGGDNNNEIITTSLNFGFCSVCGTSVSAAIATGILALEMSTALKSEMQMSYVDIMKKNCVQYRTPEAHLPQLIKSKLANICSPKKVNLIQAAISNTEKSMLNLNGNDPKFGWGIIRPWS